MPAYTTYDAGVTAQLTRGTLTFAATNITNTYAGVFSSPANAVPYTTVGGYVIPNIARPLTPRTYSLTYSVKFGPRHDVADRDGVSRARFGRRRFFGGGSGAREARAVAARSGRSGGGGGGFRSLFSPLPQTPPADPFVVGANPATCSAENVGKARQLSAELKAYRAQIEAARTAAGYPATMAAPALTRCDGHLSRSRHDLRAGGNAKRERRCCASSRAACRCTSRAPTT